MAVIDAAATDITNDAAPIVAGVAVIAACIPDGVQWVPATWGIHASEFARNPSISAHRARRWTAQQA